MIKLVIKVRSVPLKPKRLKRKIFLLISSVGPGLFLIGYNIGTGSVTTMAKAGAEYGMTLFWALVLSALFTYVLMVAYGQVTLVTGNTALFNIRKHFSIGPVLAVYILIALVTGELLAIMGVMGIVTELLAEGGQLLGFGSISTLWITVVIVLALYALLWYGRYKAFEKVLIFFVILMGLCFMVVFVLVKPDMAAIGKGFIPSIPSRPGAFQLVADHGWHNLFCCAFIMRSTVVVEKAGRSVI